MSQYESSPFLATWGLPYEIVKRPLGSLAYPRNSITSHLRKLRSRPHHSFRYGGARIPPSTYAAGTSTSRLRRFQVVAPQTGRVAHTGTRRAVTAVFHTPYMYVVIRRRAITQPGQGRIRATSKVALASFLVYAMPSIDQQVLNVEAEGHHCSSIRLGRLQRFAAFKARLSHAPRSNHP